MAEPPKPDAPFPVTSIGGDVVALPDSAIPAGTDVVFHLAAVVSAQAEADYDLGRRVNIRGTDAVIDRCRTLGTRPRVVFTSSVASFSANQNTTLPDNTRQIPGNSYGAQKAAAELILADASRRGFLDAVSLRLPTVIVRPGRPNKAASSFFSGIVREPLLGLDTELPVGDDFAVWVCSPRRAVDWLLHAAAMDTSTMGLDRSIDPPGISTTVAHLLQALEEVAPGASSHVKRVARRNHRRDRLHLASGLRGLARPDTRLFRPRTGPGRDPRLRRGRSGRRRRPIARDRAVLPRTAAQASRLTRSSDARVVRTRGRSTARSGYAPGPWWRRMAQAGLAASSKR